LDPANEKGHGVKAERGPEPFRPPRGKRVILWVIRNQRSVTKLKSFRLGVAGGELPSLAKVQGLAAPFAKKSKGGMGDARGGEREKEV